MLDQINQKAGVELIRVGRKNLSTTQYVGLIQAGQYSIQILPKIDCDPDANSDAIIGSYPYQRATSSAAQNFLHLLAHTHGLKLHELSISSLSTSQGKWIEMLVRLFSNELYTQLQQGFQQDYVRREELLPYIRGRWNIARQFIRQPNLVQGLDVSFDDYLPDILMNRIFKLTVNRLLLFTSDKKNRQILTDMENWLQPVKLIEKLSSTDLDRVVINRLNERFFTAFTLARLFLEGQTIQTLTGGQHASAFVFDMDYLFEKFVANILQTYKRRIFPSQWQDITIDIQGGMIKRYLIEPPYPFEQKMFMLKPDIILNHNGLPGLIIDTKNKALPLQKPYRAVAEGDAYQMLAYATQLQCPNVLLLYPRTLSAWETIPVSLSIERTPIRLFVATLDLHQPLFKLDKHILELKQLFESIQVQELTTGR